MKRVILFLALLTFFSCLAVIYTYPLVKYTYTGMPYTSAASEVEELVHMGQGDYIQLYYYMWLFKDSLLGHTPLFTDPYQLNVPHYGLHEHFNNQYIPLSFFYSLFAILFGDTAGYNFLIWLTFPLAGFGFYLLARLWTRSFWPAFVGAVIYTLYPYRVAHLLGGQPGGFTHSFLPWIFYFYVLGLQRKDWKFGVLSGICFFGLGLDEFHVAYYIPVFLGVFFLLPVFQVNSISKQNKISEALASDVQKSGQSLRPYASAVAVFGALLGLFLSWWSIRRIQSIYIWALIPAGVLVALVLWRTYAGLISKLSGRSFDEVMKKDTLSFLPFTLFLIYPVQFFFEVPGLGSRLLALALGLFLLVKAYYLWGYRKYFFQKSGYAVQWDWKRFGVLIGFAIPAFLLGVWLMFEKITKLDSSVVAEGRPIGMIKLYSPHWQDLLIRFQYDSEKFVYPGVFALLLAVFAFFAYTRRLKNLFSRLDFCVSGILAFMYVLTVYLSFGPRLDHFFPLYNFFYQNVPHFNYVRVPTRILYLSFFFLSLLASFGLKVLMEMAGNKKSSFLGCLLAAAVCLDYLPQRPPGISLMRQEHALYQYVKDHLGDKRLLEIPIWPGESSWSSLYLYYATRYRLPIVNGYRPAISLDYVEKVFKKLSPINEGEMNQNIWSLLKDFGVKFILLHEEAFPAKVSAFPAHFSVMRHKESGFLNFVRRTDDMYLYEVADNPDLSKENSKRINPVCTLLEAEYFNRKEGDVFEDLEASDLKTVYVTPESGAVWWLSAKGRGYPGGVYEALLRARIGNHQPEQAVLTLEIWDKAKERLLARLPLKGKDFSSSGYQDFSLQFKVENYAEIEPRIFYEGKMDVWCDRISIGFWMPPSSTAVYEAEELWHTGVIADEPSASGGEVVAGKKGSPRRNLVWGPYRTYQPGQYKARFWLKSSPQENKDTKTLVTAALLVSVDYGKKNLAEKSLRLRAFKGENYQPFEINFELKETKAVEFTVRFEGNHPLWVDRIEVEKTES